MLLDDGDFCLVESHPGLEIPSHRPSVTCTMMRVAVAWHPSPVNPGIWFLPGEISSTRLLEQARKCALYLSRMKYLVVVPS